jgi:hypothetical protein
MLRKGVFIGAFAILAGMAALQAVPAESAAPSMSAFSENVTAKSQKQTIAASNATVVRDAPWGGYSRDSARRARNSFGADQTRGGFPDELVGGTFAWPYYNYCVRHWGDQNC